MKIAKDMNGKEIKEGMIVNKWALIGKKTGEPKVGKVKLVEGMHGTPDEPMIWIEGIRSCHHPKCCEVITAF